MLAGSQKKGYLLWVSVAAWAIFGGSVTLGDKGGGGHGGGGSDYTHRLVQLDFSAASVNDAGLVVGAKNGRACLVVPEDANGDGEVDTWFEDADADGVNDLLINLGALTLDPIGGGSGASDINSVGQIIGSSYGEFFDPHGYPVSHAFIINPIDGDGDGDVDTWFEDADTDGVNDLMIDLGAAAGEDWGSYASCISDNGYVVGDVFVGIDYFGERVWVFRPFIIAPEDSDGDGAQDTWYRDDLPPDGQNDLMIVLDTLGRDEAGSRGVSNDGWVTGWASNLPVPQGGQGPRTGFVLIPEDGDGDGVPDSWFRDDDEDGLNDLTIELFRADGAPANARGINSLGQVVGSAGYSKNGPAPDDITAVRWDIDPVTHTVTPTDLGRRKPSDDWAPVDISDAGQIIGNVTFGGDGYLWQDGQITRPLDGLADGDGVRELWLDRINNLGVILADGNRRHGGQDFGFRGLLIPIPPAP